MSNGQLPAAPDGEVILRFRPAQIGITDQAWAIRMVDGFVHHAQEWLENRSAEATEASSSGATVEQIIYHAWYDEATGMFCWYEEIIYSDGTVEKTETQCGPKLPPRRDLLGPPDGAEPPE